MRSKEAAIMPNTKEKPTLTVARNGTKEQKVPLSEVHIPDLYAYADSLIESEDYRLQHAGRAIMATWLLAHDLLRELYNVHASE